MEDEERRLRQREATRRYREKMRAEGKAPKARTEAQKEAQRVAMAQRRADAKARGEVLKTDQWAKENPDKHRSRVRRWRGNNTEKARDIGRKNQATRRSTPWGAINNRIWPVMHNGVRINSETPDTLYALALGYPWSALRAHLEAQFSPEMNWENWGEVWELDHIKPLSSFKYESLADPLFRECWALSNLRPLPREANAAKGSRIAA